MLGSGLQSEYLALKESYKYWYGVCKKFKSGHKKGDTHERRRERLRKLKKLHKQLPYLEGCKGKNVTYI